MEQPRLGQPSTKTYTARTVQIVAAATSLLTLTFALVILNWMGWLTPPTINRQSSVHNMGQTVMPFDLGETTHVFEMTETGGIQEVISDDPSDDAQVSLIRQHLQHEALRFGAGDFSDPTSLHGSNMPGLAELAQGAESMTIDYTELPAGARLTFSTSESILVTAIHRWFGAQLSDHASDATYR
jgi:hypothetical protein